MAAIAASAVTLSNIPTAACVAPGSIPESRSPDLSGGQENGRLLVSVQGESQASNIVRKYRRAHKSAKMMSLGTRKTKILGLQSPKNPRLHKKRECQIIPTYQPVEVQRLT